MKTVSMGIQFDVVIGFIKPNCRNNTKCNVISNMYIVYILYYIYINIYMRSYTSNNYIILRLYCTRIMSIVIIS